jgi:hypothetical protein
MRAKLCRNKSTIESMRAHVQTHLTDNLVFRHLLWEFHHIQEPRPNFLNILAKHRCKSLTCINPFAHTNMCDCLSYQGVIKRLLRTHIQSHPNTQMSAPAYYDVHAAVVRLTQADPREGATIEPRANATKIETHGEELYIIQYWLPVSSSVATLYRRAEEVRAQVRPQGIKQSMWEQATRKQNELGESCSKNEELTSPQTIRVY